MQYQVLVQPQQQTNYYIASVLGVADCVAEGSTKELAVANAKAVLTEHLAKGEIVTIEIETESGPTENAWLKNFGGLRDDPTFDDFMAEMAAQRQLTTDK